MVSGGRDDRQTAGLASIPVAAAYLSLSKNKLYQLVNSGEVPSKRFGRAVRIPWKWLHEQARVEGDDFDTN